MFDFHFKRPGRLAFGVAVVAGVLTLAACGGSDNDGGGSTTTPPTAGTPNPGSTLDSFIQIVKALVATTSETTEPVPVTDVKPTTPENVEPDPTV